MPSHNNYDNATAAAAEPHQNPRTYQHHHHAAVDAFHLHQQPSQAAVSQAESLPCPRCDSKNTKFCYYNNYNLSQPRHFCKSCRRYWTHGGTLRNVPVGGGTRKSASISYHTSSSNKCPRSSPAAISPRCSSSTMSGQDGAPCTKPQAARSVEEMGVTSAADGVGAGVGGGLGLGFASQLSTPGSSTFLALGGYGPGYVPALDGLGFGFCRGVWPCAEVGFIESSEHGGFHSPLVGPAGVGTWHIGPSGGGGNGGDGEEGGGGGLTDGEGFAWPELAISMPGQGLK